MIIKTVGTKVRTRILAATYLSCLIMLLYTSGVIFAEFRSFERGARTEARGLAKSLAYGASFANNLQEYVAGLADLHRDIVFVDVLKRGIADADPNEIGMFYDCDQGNEVSSTIADGRTRTFVEQNEKHPEGIKQIVVPAFAKDSMKGTPIGAVILDYSAIYAELLDASIWTIYVLAMAGAGCTVGMGLLGFRLANAVRASAQKIHHLAFHDELTGLANRSLFSTKLNARLSVAQGRYGDVAVFFIDLDRFKNVNDTLGHAAGDILLKEAANRIQSCFRSDDLVARFGGDEFVVMVDGVSDVESLGQLARKVLAAMAHPIRILGQEFRVTASIGISAYPADGEDEQLLMRNADIAMYQAKQDGKNGFAVYAAQMNQYSVEQLAFESSFRHAVEEEQFQLYYQPKIDSVTGRIAGVEALLRWDHPDLGSVPPKKFIALAEETGLIVPLGRWVLRRACEQQVAWNKQGMAPMCVAVNLSPRQFADEHLFNDVRSSLAATGMAPGCLELEITESMLIEESGRALELLQALHDLGVKLSVDDFGTGYSSLSNLKRFPVDTIKVDRSFIRELPDNVEDRAITEAIIAMGRTLALNVVAEGVETQEQAEFLRDRGCDQLQGFYFSKAVPPSAIFALLEVERTPD